MEEECGNFSEAKEILVQGLKYLPFNENLFMKTFLILEKLGSPDGVDQLLNDFKIQGFTECGSQSEFLEKSWEILLQAAVFTGR